MFIFEYNLNIYLGLPIHLITISSNFAPDLFLLYLISLIPYLIKVEGYFLYNFSTTISFKENINKSERL